MKRFHVHVSVASLPEGIAFYSKMFGSAPSESKPDYAKWMLDDPRLNFAISRRGAPAGVDHLGFQVDSDAELAELRAQLAAAGIDALDQKGAACCYARSDKHWVQDPSGIAWETFHSLDSIPVFGEDREPSSQSAGGCCAPQARPAQAPQQAGCCAPVPASGCCS